MLLSTTMVDGRACVSHLWRSTSRGRSQIVYYTSVDCNLLTALGSNFITSSCSGFVTYNLLLQLCSCRQDFNWHSALRGPSAVTCSYVGRQLGNQYGAGTGQIWLDEMTCQGNELTLSSCSHNDWGDNNCSHDEDVSISCTWMRGVLLIYASVYRRIGRYRRSKHKKSMTFLTLVADNAASPMSQPQWWANSNRDCTFGGSVWTIKIRLERPRIDLRLGFKFLRFDSKKVKSRQISCLLIDAKRYAQIVETLLPRMQFNAKTAPYCVIGVKYNASHIAILTVYWKSI